MQLDLFGPVRETMTAGDVGSARFRRDKAVKRYLLAKRPQADALQRIISYRTECVVGYNQASADDAATPVLDLLLDEYEWALERLRELDPDLAARLSA